MQIQIKYSLYNWAEFKIKLKIIGHLMFIVNLAKINNTYFSCSSWKFRNNVPSRYLLT